LKYLNQNIKRCPKLKGFYQKKRYNEILRMAIADSVEIILNTIAHQTKLNEKGKNFYE